MKSNGEESSSNYNLAISTLSAKDISLNSNTINALASIIEATNVDVNTKLLNLDYLFTFILCNVKMPRL